MLKIKELQRNQVFYGKDSKGEPYRFKVWMYPTEDDGIWSVDCTDEGDFIFTFTEDDEPVLFLSEDLV